jgi:hypothetical protein
MVFLAINGEPLLQLWMGHSYADAPLMLILTFAFTADIVYQPLSNLLLGLNLHGRPGVIAAFAAGVAIALASIALHFGYGLRAVAMSMAIPWTLIHGVYLPLFTCRRLKIPLWEFFSHVWTRPLLCSLPFALALAFGRVMFPHSDVLGLIVGGLLGGIVLAICYWIWVMPPSWKQRILGRFAGQSSEPTGLLEPADEGLVSMPQK